MVKHVKVSKEMKAVSDSISKWVNKHDRNVVFFAGFIAFDSNSDVINKSSLKMCYGHKDTAVTALDLFAKDLKKVKKDFVNW